LFDLKFKLYVVVNIVKLLLKYGQPDRLRDKCAMNRDTCAVS